MSVTDKHPRPWKTVGTTIVDANDNHVATAAGDVAVARLIVEAVNNSSTLNPLPLPR